jgi:hypothetical protein
MADNEMNGLFMGNLGSQPLVDGREHECAAIPRLLVEEAIPISLADLRRLFGRQELLKAAQDARPVKFQINGNVFSICLLAEPHRVPNRNRQASDKEATRLWICCFGCRRKVRKVYTYPRLPGSNTLLMAQCRSCHGLTYQSANCSSNKWWKEIARPLKRLLRRRELLLAKKPTAKITAQLDLIDQSINLLRRRANPATSARRKKSASTGARRPYRDLSPILQSLSQ